MEGAGRLWLPSIYSTAVRMAVRSVCGISCTCAVLRPLGIGDSDFSRIEGVADTTPLTGSPTATNQSGSILCPTEQKINAGCLAANRSEDADFQWLVLAQIRCCRLAMRKIRAGPVALPACV